MSGIETLYYSKSEIVDVNGNPYLLEDPSYEDIFQKMPLTRRELFTLAFTTSVILSGIGEKIGIDTFIKNNSAVDTVLNVRNIECRADSSIVEFSEEELMNLWQAFLGDSIGRGHADNEMKDENDVLPSGDVIVDKLGLLFAPRSIAKLHLFNSGEYNMDTHVGHAAILSEKTIETLQYAFETRQMGTINLAHNQTPIEVIPYQLQTLESTGFFEHTKTRAVHQSAGGNDPNIKFQNAKFTRIAKAVVNNQLDLTSVNDALDIFNEIDKSLDPISEQQYLDLVNMKKLHDTKGNIKAQYVYGNVKLGSAAGLVTTRYLGKNKGYEILVPKDPRVRQVANIFSAVIQNKKKEGINKFLDTFPNRGFEIVFLDLYTLLGDGFLGDKRLFLYEHPTKLGYQVIAQHILSRMRVNDQSFEEFRESKNL